MEESIERRINEIYQETLKQNFDEDMKYDTFKQYDFVSKNYDNEHKLKKDIIKKNFFDFIEVIKKQGKKGFLEILLLQFLCLFISIISMILGYFEEDLITYYEFIAGFFGIIGIWGFDSNLNALKYYADLYSKEFIRKRIFG
ncbi:hypothetical protein [Campylobacter coli]|uniref:hypothetical protein n=1 Tax=Campylobacter coli TaxID=195 RepID=UPI00127C933B|nr:hypothetical protein [Campylobacter coli]HEF8181829.1 hypothetical protein [Campylobacter jejuni]EAK2928275.1 hypothetical protein [Campylobacter coli]EAL4563860.1 hypothetical protein [Campylobacter coli]EBF6040387.1 hypothetical protein [Campylobacter coli]